MRRGLLGAVAVTVLLGIYVWAVAGRSFALIGTGEPIAVVIGVAVLVIPVLGLVFLVREWQMAAAVQRMADILAASGQLPVDDLPRSPSGRIAKNVAQEAFLPVRAAVERAPDDWRAWFNVAFAYDAAGDRRRARGALRTAAALFQAERSTSEGG